MKNVEMRLTDDRKFSLKSNVDNYFVDINLVANAQLELLVSLYNDIANLVVPKVIKHLKNLNGDSLLSGEDSNLKNTWEEICAQVQHDYSFYWEMYIITIDGIIEDELNKLPSSFKELISYLGVVNEEPHILEYSESDAILAIRNDLLTIAGKYRNANIDNYLDNLC